MKTFRTTILGIGPFCVEFDDGEIVHTRSEERQKLIAAAPAMKEALERIEKWDFDIRGDCVADAQKLARAVLAKAKPC